MHCIEFAKEKLLALLLTLKVKEEGCEMNTLSFVAYCLRSEEIKSKLFDYF